MTKMLNFLRVGHNDGTDLSLFLGQRSRKVGQLLRDTAEVSKKVVKWFLRPKFGERGSKLFWGICKSTPLPTYWPSLVEIPWLVFHLCWRNKKIKITVIKFNGLAFGGHNNYSSRVVITAVTRVRVIASVISCWQLHFIVYLNLQRNFYTNINNTNVKPLVIYVACRRN